MSKIIEKKSFTLEFKEVDSQGMLRGYASTFGNIDLGNDVVDKGAFKKSIKEQQGKFPILADHDPSKLIGWNLRAEEDDSGLLVEGQLDLNVQLAREKYSLVKNALKNNIKMGLSIGYMVIKAEPDRKSPMVRHLKELKLFEYSIVTFPMNTEAMVTGLKDFNSPVHIDNVKKIIAELESNGITKADLMKALGENQAAKSQFDPAKVSQSIDNMIALFKP